MKRLSIDVTDSLHREIKIHSANLGIPMQRFARGALQFYLDSIEYRTNPDYSDEKSSEMSGKEPKNIQNTPEKEPK